MLKRVGGEINPEGAVTTISKASFPVPFPAGLEFNSPAHGNWNIVHTGMLMPEAIQIYVCADNCMRGVVLTAAEMNAAERFSFVIIEEENLLNGNLEDVTIEGVTDVLNKLEQKPKAVLLFTVCLHHFLGCDLDRVYEELEVRFPQIVFVRCFMDPIMQKHGVTPDQKLRKAMYDPLTEQKAVSGTVSLIGSDFTLDESSDIRRILRTTGYTLKELPGCRTGRIPAAWNRRTPDFLLSTGKIRCRYTGRTPQKTTPVSSGKLRLWRNQRRDSKPGPCT